MRRDYKVTKVEQSSFYCNFRMILWFHAHLRFILFEHEIIAIICKLKVDSQVKEWTMEFEINLTLHYCHIC